MSFDFVQYSFPCGCVISQDSNGLITTTIPCPLHVAEAPSVPPLYWQAEVSGRLRTILGRFFKENSLTDNDLGLIRWYVWQWVRSDAVPFKPPDWEPKILGTKDREDLMSVVGWLLEYAIDPF